MLTNTAETSDESDICEGNTSVWLRFHNGGLLMHK